MHCGTLEGIGEHWRAWKSIMIYIDMQREAEALLDIDEH